MVTLDAAKGSIPDQLNAILAEHSVKLMDLFREWDVDGNGAIDKKEFRQAVAALGYDVPKAEMNAAFDQLDHSGDGFIEYDEFKAALSKHSKKGKAAPPPVVKAPSKAAVEAEGVRHGDHLNTPSKWMHSPSHLRACGSLRLAG